MAWQLTAGVTRKWPGVDAACEQKKLEARKLSVKRSRCEAAVPLVGRALFWAAHSQGGKSFEPVWRARFIKHLLDLERAFVGRQL